MKINDWLHSSYNCSCCEINLLWSDNTHCTYYITMQSMHTNCFLITNGNFASRGLFLKSPETFRAYFGWHNFLCIFKTKASRGTELQLFLFLFPLQHMKRPALQNKQVVHLRMAFRARKVLGTFEKQGAVPIAKKWNSWLRIFDLRYPCFPRNVMLVPKTTFLKFEWYKKTL